MKLIAVQIHVVVNVFLKQHVVVNVTNRGTLNNLCILTFYFFSPWIVDADRRACCHGAKGCATMLVLISTLNHDFLILMVFIGLCNAE